MSNGLTEQLRATAERVREAESFDEWKDAVDAFSDLPRTLITTFASMPHAAEGFAQELGDRLPKEQLELIREIGERGRELGDESELRQAVRGMAEGDAAKYYIAKEDPLQVMRYSPQLTMSRGKLELRVIGGPSHDKLSIDFVKSPGELVALSSEFMEFILSALDHMTESELPIERFVDGGELTTELSRLRELAGKVASRFD